MYMPPNNDTNFVPPPEGTHRALCYRVIDLGTQPVEWQGVTKHQHKVLVSWELSDELMEDGQPFTVHQRYTFSSSEKSNFRKHLEAWRGKRFEDSDFGPGGFDIKNVIGVPCLLSLLHTVKDNKTWANISGITPLLKSMEKPAAINDSVYLSLDPGEFNVNTFSDLSEGLQDTIRRSPEYAELQKARGGEHVMDENTNGNWNGDDEIDDEIPF
jgi:hypothetical protein